MAREEEKRAIIDLLETPGWKLVSAWLDEWDQEITDAVKKNIVNLKADEAIKWHWFYNGRYSQLDRLRKRVRDTVRESQFDKLKNKMEHYLQ